jgi:hypothetical protein
VLLATLRDRGIEVLEPTAGESTYRDAIVRETSTMTIPGSSLRGATATVFRIPRMRVWCAPSESNGKAPRFDPRDLDDVILDDGGEVVRFEDLPSGPGDRIVVMAGAGAGKSELLRALAHRLGRSSWVPVLVRLVDLANHGRPVVSFLEERMNERYATNIRWIELCDRGTALLLFDGLDELPPHHRSFVFDELQAFSARFPLAPWVMTVRDAAGTVAPANARLVELQSLALDDVQPFCEGWLPPDRASVAREIAAKVSLSPELRRMARIPFLLALILEHVLSGDGTLPTHRSELLERYVNALLRPEKWKPSLAAGVDAGALRAAGEALAFSALDSGEPDVPGKKAIAAVGESAPQATLDALVARGLLRDIRGERYAFVFPIVQEYLAGFYIAARRAAEIVQRFEAVSSRPWMQALQFAIELSDPAEPFVRELLEKPDDAFRTNLKILGRCIANGARVSTATWLRIGDALAAEWIAENRDGKWTGNLIADAFATALPAAAHQRLCEGEQLEFGGAEMIVGASDAALTESVLRAILKVKIPGHVNAWQSAIDAIAPRAARLYLERTAIATAANREREIHWLGYLLGRLADVRTADDPRIAYANSPDGDPLLRLACLLRLGSPLPETAEPLVIESFRRYVATETENESPMFDVTFDALFRLPRAHDAWRTLLALVETTPLYAKPGVWWLFGLSPAEAYWRTVVFAVVRRVSEEQALGLVQGLRESQRREQTRNDYLDLVLAYLGDADAFNRVGRRVDTLHWRDATSWAYLASHHTAGSVTPHLDRLRQVLPKHRLEIAFALGFAFSYEIEMMGLRGGVRGKARRRHAAAPIAAALLRAWADDAKPGSPERFACLAQAVNLGAHEIAPSVLAEVVDRMSRPLESDTDHRMSDALWAVAETGTAIPIEMLIRAAQLSNHNLGFRAIHLLERQRTAESLKELLTLHACATNAERKRVLAGHIERIARALSVRVVGDPSSQMIIA